MAKDKDMTKVNGSGSALAAPAGDQLPAIYIPSDDGRPPLASIRLFNNTAEEVLKWPNLKWGQYYNSVTGDPLGEKVRIVALDYWREWARWEEGQNRPVYSTRNKAEIPPEDLKWTGPDGKTPPAATETVNLIVIEQETGYPFLVPFKRTSLKSFQKGFAQIEAYRRVQNKGTGLYELFSEQDKSADNKPYKRMMIRYVSDVPADLLAVCKVAAASLAEIKAEAEQLAAREAAGRGGDDEIPI